MIFRVNKSRIIFYFRDTTSHSLSHLNRPIGGYEGLYGNYTYNKETKRGRTTGIWIWKCTGIQAKGTNMKYKIIPTSSTILKNCFFLYFPEKIFIENVYFLEKSLIDLMINISWIGSWDSSTYCRKQVKEIWGLIGTGCWA